jgi:hypothetical protein
MILNFEKMNFNYGMQIYLKNNTSIKNSIYSDLFIINTILKKSDLNVNANENNQKNEKIYLSNCPCRKEDFSENQNENENLMKKIPLEDLICLKNISNVELQGSHFDEKTSYIQNEIKINKKYLTKENENFLQKAFEENVFKFKLFYIDTLNDIYSLNNPIVQKIDSFTTYLDLNSLKKIKIKFQQFSYLEDKNTFTHNYIKRDFLKQVSLQENQLSIPKRISNNENDYNINNDINIYGRDNLLQIKLLAHNNIKIVIKDFTNLFEFLTNILYNLTNLLIWSSIFIGMYNLIQAKQYVMSKIMKYTDSFNERSMSAIRSIKKSFDEREISNKVKKLFDFKNLSLGGVNMFGKNIVKNNDKELEKKNIVNNNTKNEKKLFNMSFLKKENKENDNKDKDKNKDKDNNNKEKKENNLNKENDNNAFDPNNFEDKKNQNQDKNQHQKKSSQIPSELDSSSNSIIPINKKNNERDKKGQFFQQKISQNLLEKEKLPNDNLEEINNDNIIDIENNDLIVEESLKHAKAMTFWEIVLYIFSFGHIKLNNNKEMVFLNAHKIFDKNLDVINFMNKMQEIEILKYIILDGNLLDIMNFISKPSVSMANDISDKIQDDEYKKFFYPKEKVNSIDVEHIDNLKNSFEILIDKKTPSTIETRMLNLFNIQLIELMNKSDN